MCVCVYLHKRFKYKWLFLLGAECNYSAPNSAGDICTIVPNAVLNSHSSKLLGGCVPWKRNTMVLSDVVVF